jgi:hypothetical protein
MIAAFLFQKPFRCSVPRLKRSHTIGIICMRLGKGVIPT